MVVEEWDVVFLMDENERIALEGWAKLPCFKRKVEQAQEIIRQGLAIAPGYVACSWGKDSIVLMHLAQQIKPDIPVISFGHSDRELISNYAETEKTYCDQFFPNLETINIAGDHVPLKVKRAKLWERYPVAFIGLRKEESARRRYILCRYTAIYQYRSKNWRVCPLSDWLKTDIWSYIVQHKLPYLKLYDAGAERTTDHVSKTSKFQYQAERLETFRKIAPEYYQYLKEVYPEMFYA